MLLRRQAQQLRVQETESKATGKPLMKWLHLDGTVMHLAPPTHNTCLVTSQQGRHTPGDVLRERKAGSSPLLCTHRTFVAGKVHKLVHTKRTEA